MEKQDNVLCLGLCGGKNRNQWNISEIPGFDGQVVSL